MSSALLSLLSAKLPYQRVHEYEYEYVCVRLCGGADPYEGEGEDELLFFCILLHVSAFY